MYMYVEDRYGVDLHKGFVGVRFRIGMWYLLGGGGMK